ncbi:MAG: sugar ABC transporter permease [Candidatus Izimaplasma sp.]|nr:sugar ABC transporter permease [Candidatus Izimaplasma bacterium]
MLQERLTAQGLDMDNDDYNKMLARIYFEYSPETYETIVNQVNNPVYENAGFFVKGVWGVITLGTVPQRTMYQHQILGFLLPASGTQSIEAVSIEFAGHHSTQLLLRGIISSLVLLYILFIYGWNVRDAYKTGKLYKEEGKQNEKDYFSAVYENSFEYIVLTPALVLVTFITVMPIIFGFLVAFTNYNINHIPPGQLINWVGLRNFVEVFSLTSGSSIDFGGQFWSVFSWTMIWAVFATATCFFGGFIQAVILNNKRIVFRKAWRGILILPWAVPALISQMIFRVIFNDNGYVNQILTRVGVTDLLKDWGMLGRPLAEAGTGIDKFLYFGDQSIQWLSNEANPWFVRIFLIILNIWLGFPFFMALMSGVMTSIDESLYEAASIDGATGFQQFRFITMPLVLFATSPLLVMTFAGNFNNFGVIYFITGGGPGGGTYETAFAGSTDILISWIYTLTVDANVRWYNMASVFSILIFLIIGTLSAWNFTRTRAFKESD